MMSYIVILMSFQKSISFYFDYDEQERKLLSTTFYQPHCSDLDKKVMRDRVRKYESLGLLREFCISITRLHF